MSTYRVPVWTTGERMAKARRDAGLSQAEMADLLTTPERPVSKQTVSNWEKGVNQPRQFQQVLEQWAKTTNVSVLWLLGFEDAASLSTDTRSGSSVGELVGAAA
jgi:transcriptional regulator with XRE-family HTH domain